MNFAALPWKACLAMCYIRSRKSEKVSTVRSYFAWSHLYLVTSFRLSLVNSFRNLSNTSVKVASVEIVSDWKNSVASFSSKFWKYRSFASLVSRLLNGRRWLRSRCSKSLKWSLFPRNIGTCVCKSLWFVFVACSLLENTVIASMMFL